MPKLRVSVAAPDLGSVSYGPLAVAVTTDGKARFLEVDFEQAADQPEPVEAELFRELCRHHQLGAPEFVPDKPQPAAKAESAEKEQ